MLGITVERNPFSHAGYPGGCWQAVWPTCLILLIRPLQARDTAGSSERIEKERETEQRALRRHLTEWARKDEFVEQVEERSSWRDGLSFEVKHGGQNDPYLGESNWLFGSVRRGRAVEDPVVSFWFGHHMYAREQWNHWTRPFSV